jgi:hypothetical protein
MLPLFADDVNSKTFLDTHSAEITIVILAGILLLGLLLLVPQLLRAHQKTLELQHEEHMRALEKGEVLPRSDERSKYAGRAAALVPMVVICAAGTVTCFLSAYKPDALVTVTITVWAVAGVVSLAAITGGVALMSRIAQLNAGIFDEEEDEVPEDLVEK